MTFFSLSLHIIISFKPALLAASTFSLIPPTGNTLPLKVISPVMAKNGRIGFLAKALQIAESIVTPAEGPSFGMAPSGT